MNLKRDSPHNEQISSVNTAMQRTKEVNEDVLRCGFVLIDPMKKAHPAVKLVYCALIHNDCTHFQFKLNLLFLSRQ